MNVALHSFSDFIRAPECDVIMNFVGLGAPARIANESNGLLALDQSVDEACMALVRLNPKATYLYLSSGASYGSDFSKPATDHSELPDDSKFELPRDMYGWVKRSTELRHRQAKHHKIINLRIFGYASRNMDVDAGFLLSDLAKSLLTQAPVQITSDKTIRDFINPEYFFKIVEFCISNELPNTSIDLVSSKPVDKTEIVDALVAEYKLNVEWVKPSSSSNSRLKENYYSLSNRLTEFGFSYPASALEMVLEEFRNLSFTNQV